MNKPQDILERSHPSLPKTLFSGFEAVIGVEVHIQLNTVSKLFCSCANRFGQQPNHNTCQVCLGLPGSLPVLNGAAVDSAIKMALAIGGTIKEKSVFARKQYFYPDLPKGYQITQYDLPYCVGGSIVLSSGMSIPITRIHLEEDAGKSIHGDNCSFVDLNRAGTPLLEMVSEPALGTPAEAADYLKTVRGIVQYLGISDGNLEEGSIRCDANVSIKRPEDTKMGTRTEIKNLNSFRNVERAVSYEILRQVDMITSNERIIQQTVRFDASTGKTKASRSKEDSADYRYFPDPDLRLLCITPDRIEAIKESLPELPSDKVKRLTGSYGLSCDDATILTSEKSICDFYEGLVSVAHLADPKICANWLITEYLREAREGEWDMNHPKISKESFGELINLVADATISGKIAKSVFKEMVESGSTPKKIVEEKGLIQVTDSKAIEEAVQLVLDKFKDQVQQYLSGKEKMLGFFVGQIMKDSKGRFNPGLVNKVLKESLDDLRK